MFGSQSALYSTCINVEAAFDDLRCQQLLTRSPFVFGLRDRTLDVFGVFLERFGLQFFPIRRFDFCDPLPDRFDSRIDFCNFFVIGVGFVFGNQGVRRFDITKDGGL